MAFADDYELINGIPVPKKYIKQPEIVPLPEEQPDWQAQHELPAAAPVNPSPTIAPVDSQPAAAPAPVAPQMAPVPEAVAQPLTPENLPTVQDLQQMPQAAPAPVVEPEAVKAEVRAKEAPTEVGPEAPPDPAPNPVMESQQREMDALAEGAYRSAEATKAANAAIAKEEAKLEETRKKRELALQQATEDVKTASNKYQEQLAQKPPDRKTQNLLTILFSTLATAMSRGKIPNNAIHLIQAGAEQQERENMRSNAQAKAEVDRARQLYGDLSAGFDAEEHVIQTRILGHNKKLVRQLEEYAAGNNSAVAKEKAIRLADEQRAINEAAEAKLAADQEEALAKREAEEEKRRIEREKLDLSKQQFQLDKTKTYADIADKRDARKLGWARLSYDERRALKDDEKQALETEYKKGEIARLKETVQGMREGKTVKLVNGEKYSAPTAKIAEDLANVEVFSSHALTGLDELLNTRVEEGKQFWDSPAGKRMTTLYTDLLLQLKGPEYAALGVIAGPDMALMEGLAGKNPADAWLSTKPQLEGLRKRIAQRRAAKHKILGQYEGEVKEIERRLPADAAKITPEQAESQFRTAVTAAGTVTPAEDRKAGADAYDAQMKAAGRLPDAYRKFAIAKDEEEAAISRLQDQVKALPSGDPQAAALQDQIAQRKETAQYLGLKEREYETRFREQGGVKKLNANREAVLKEVQGRQKARSLASEIFNEYMVAEDEPVYAEIQKLRAEGRDIDAADALLKAQRGKPGADVLLGKIQKIRKLYRD